MENRLAPESPEQNVRNTVRHLQDMNQGCGGNQQCAKRYHQITYSDS